MNLLRTFPIAIALAATACATTQASSSYVHILDAEQIFAAADWTPDLDAAVKASGWSDRAEIIKARMNEKGGWPEKMKDQDARWFQKDRIKQYNVVEIARLSFYDQPAVFLHVPAAANQHMPDGWKPTEDFFIMVSEAGVPPR